MADIYKQTANMFGMDEYTSAYRTKPTDNTPSLQTLLEKIGYDFTRDDDNNLVSMQKSPDPNLPKLTSVLDAYRHAAFSAIEANKRGSTTAKLFGTGKEIIDISAIQMLSFCGNILEIKNNQNTPLIVMSTNAFEAFDKNQIKSLEKYGDIIHSPLNTIEKYGGGSARCMIAEVFLPKKTN